MSGSKRPASTPSQVRQARVWIIIAVIGVMLMVLAFNPWRSTGGTATGSASASSSATSSGHPSKKARNGTLEQQAATMFTGDAESIADEVRELLNAPEDSNVDTLSNLLYRHDHRDLAEASDLYDAIGSERPVERVRALARQWYPQAMRAAIDARLDDLESALSGAGRAADRLDRLGSADASCKSLRGAYETAKSLVNGKSQDYDALTKAQQDLTSATSGCAASLEGDQLTKVFGQAQGSTDGTDGGDGR